MKFFSCLPAPHCRVLPCALAWLILGGSTALAQSSGGLQFDGSNDRVTFGAAPGLGSGTFTVETWFQRTGAGLTVSTGTGGITGVPLVTKGRGEADGNNRDMNYFLGIRGSDSVLVADFEEGAGGSSPGLNHPVAGVTAIQMGVWHHAAVTYDGNKWQVFLDGVLETELVIGQPTRGDSIQHSALGTAMNSTGSPSGFFAGVLDEVRIWDHARTESEIAASVNLQIPSAPGLLGRWALDETGSTTIAPDSSGSGINGTLVNGPIWVSGHSFEQPPTADITAPSSFSAFDAPATIGIQATASDPDGTVTQVGFFEGANLLGEDLSSPYQFNWNGVGAGQYVITVMATDDTGLTTVSAPVNVTVNNPIVSITTPAHKQVVTGPLDVLISAVASDANGPITLVEFYQGASKLGEDSSAPFEFNWLSASPGTYTLTAVSTDSGSTTETSAPVTVMILTNTPPAVAITDPQPDASFTLSDSIMISADASDIDGGVAKVEFYAGILKLGEDASSPYSFDWVNAGSGTFSLTAVAVDGYGLSSASAPVNITVDNVVQLISPGSVWRYLDDGSDQGAAWRGPGFNDSSWASGPAQLGYGDGDEVTPVASGPTSSKYITTYFRHSFNVAGAVDFSALTLFLLRDDGAVVYLNGLEIYRNNMPSSAISYNTAASSAIGGADESIFNQTALSPSLLAEGINVLAVEIHQFNGTSSDISFDFELDGERPPITVALGEPVDGAVEVNSPAMLSVTGVDPQGDDLSIAYYGRPAGVAPGSDFTIAVIPDTQYYSGALNGGQPSFFAAQTQWIVDQRLSSNIVYVAHLGDCVENGDNGGNNVEWLVATNAMYRLEDPLTTLLADGLPYGIAVGNHDQTPLGDALGTTLFYNQYFGEAHFTGRPYYGGHYGTDNDNSIVLFSGGGLDFVVVYLEYDTSPDGAVLSWANSVLQTYGNRRAIVVSHYLIGAGNPGGFGPQGQATYDALKANPNLFLMLCGHVSSEGRREDSYNGSKVYSLLSDYQSRSNGGDGWMRMLEFSPSNNVIRVKTYSPVLDQFENDAESQFNLDYSMQDLAGFTLIASHGNVPSGSSDSVLWPDLAPGSAYDWYAEVSDGTSTTVSPVRRFTTASAFVPIVEITAPADLASFIVPGDVVIDAGASDADGFVTKVDFYEGAAWLGEDTSSPYTLTWINPAEGGYVLTAVATDDGGMSSTSAPVSIIVYPTGTTNLPPVVAITGPAEGTGFLASSTIAINATATDGDGSITKVEFYEGGLLLGEVLSSPYAFAWNNVPAGGYVLEAVAYDNVNAASTSAPVSIVVTNPPDSTAIVRGPYLQSGRPDGVIVRWRTDLPAGSRLRHGLAPGSLSTVITDAAPKNNHVIDATGLLPGTRYYYELGTMDKWFGPDANNFFVTSPPPGTADPFRVWVLGDSGTADVNAANVRDGYLGLAGVPAADVWLMLGDNAYNNGTDTEHQAAVFDMYPSVLRNTVVWPTLGNHDTAGSANPPPSLPYFDIFSMPTGGEAGGVASGTENYYSFDYANVHFICLDSMASDRSSAGPMTTWLLNDLSATLQPWVVAFWHHPPYTKGSHNSDNEVQLIEMRVNALPILEAGGVDLVLSGHSHSYERSFLIDGHYGTSGTFSQAMKVDAGDGREDGSGAYLKPVDLLANQGTVYMVAGSSGKISGGLLNHPAMFISLNQLGSLQMDFDSNRLDVAFIDVNGVAQDYFTILKSIPNPGSPTEPSDLVAAALSDTEISLTWTDNASNEDGFALERSLDGINFVQFTTAGANVTSGVDRGLSAATLYYYRMLAYNGSGSSVYSGIASATTAAPAGPPPPTALAAVPGEGVVDLVWQPSPAATSYNVKRSETSGGAYVLVSSGVTSNSFTDLTVVNDTQYYYVVSSSNAVGEGSNSLEVDALPQSPPVAPDTLIATGASLTQIELSWADNSSNESGFVLDRSDDGTTYFQIAEIAADATAYADTGLTPSAAYFYRLFAYNNGGSSSFALANGSTLTPQPPSAVGAVPGDAQVTLSWLSSGANTYHVKRATISGGPYVVIATGVTGVSYVDAAASNGTRYYYVVSAIYSGVESANSAEASATPQAAPAMPSNLIATPVSASQINLTWTDNSTTELGFKVERSLDGVIYAEIAVTGADVSVYADTGLSPGTTYNYRVRAYHTVGESPPAQATGVTSPLPPNPPAGFVALATNRAVVLSWADTAGAQSYNLYRSLTGGGGFNLLIYGVFDITYTDATVVNQTEYFYVVTAVGAGGESGFSPQVSAIPFGPPLPPSNAMATGTWVDTVELTWTDNSTDELGFKVERSLDGTHFTEVIVLEADVTGYEDINLEFDTTYHYRVRSYNAEASSAPAEASGMTQTFDPVAPLGVAAAAGDGFVSLSWDASATARIHQIWRSVVSGTSYSLVTTLTNLNHVDAGVINGTTYYYVITSTNSLGSSPSSAEVSATPQVSAPSAPAGLIATPISSSAIDLVWNDTASNEDGFRVERSTDGVNFSLIGSVGVDGTAYGDSGLTSSTTYYYRVQAYHTGGGSPWSNLASATTPALLITVFLPSTGAEDGYVLESNETSGTGGSVSANSTSSSALRGGDDRKDRQYKAFLSFDTSAIPDEATIVSATVRVRRGSLTGTRPFGTHGVCYVDIKGGVGFSGSTALAAGDFQAPADASQVATLSDAPSNGDLSIGSINSSGLAFVDPAGTTQFRIYFALDDNDDGGNDYMGWYSGANGTASNRPELEVTYVEIAPVAPAAPTGLAATGGDGQVSLGWTASSGADSYTVKRSLVSGGPFGTLQSGIVPTSWLDDTAVNGTAYYYVVSAVNAGGESGNSAEAAATPALTLPLAPDGLVAAPVSASGMDLSWNDNSPNEDGFRIERSTDGSSYTQLTTVGVDATSYSDSGLAEATLYYYRVRAFNGAGDSAASQASAMTLPVNAWTGLTFDDFEAGWGNFVDGGSDCALYTGGTFAHQGNRAANLQDDSGNSSSCFLSAGLDVNGPGYTRIKIEFWYYPVSMDANEGFGVQYYDGSTWQPVAAFAQGTDFQNNQFYFVELVLDEGAYNFPAEMNLKFQCDSSGNSDDVYIDEVRISAQ